MAKKVIVVVPSLCPTGPVKGALAACKGLANHLDVTLAVLKGGSNAALAPENGVGLELLGDSGWPTRIARLRDLCRDAGGRKKVVSLSYCFSADLANRCLKSQARILSSVRGNLCNNYVFDYGTPGKILSMVHYRLLRGFDDVLAMSQAMRDQLADKGVPNARIVGNFVDEPGLEGRRLPPVPSAGSLRIVYVASLSTRKRPELLAHVVRRLLERGRDVELDFVGQGALLEPLKADCCEFSQAIRFHGHIDDPTGLIQQADYFVLPSESEGISRASLEALFLGVPCVLRDVDANGELIGHGANGFLFKDDEDLLGLLAALADGVLRVPRSGASLLPEPFTFRRNIEALKRVCQQ